MITGEFGSGKDYLARLIHARRKTQKPFIKINCSAVGNLVQHIELNEVIKNISWGTLFLENFHELDPEYYPFFAGLKCRLLASTEHPVSVGSIFHSGSLSHIHIPPLRERKDTIVHLFNYFLEFYCSEYRREVPDLDVAVYDGLLEYDWPFNVSELKKSVRAMVMIAEKNLFDVSVLPIRIYKGRRHLEYVRNMTISEAVDEVSHFLVKRALEKYAGNQIKTAAALGISEAGLRYKMKKYGLNKKTY